MGSNKDNIFYIEMNAPSDIERNQENMVKERESIIT